MWREKLFPTVYFRIIEINKELFFFYVIIKFSFLINENIFIINIV